MPQVIIGKNPNAAWKEYKKRGGTIVNFTEWLHREKEKMYSADGDNNLFLVNQSLNDSVHTAINDTLKKGGLKDSESGKTIFGINKVLVIGAGIVILGAISYLVIKKNRKPKIS